MELNSLEEKELAPWRSPLARAIHKNQSLVYARYLQLATVTPEGQPANRTIVFRGFLQQTNQLKFITDSRSQKVEEIDKNAWGEACWYFPKTREQFRLKGKLTLVKADNPHPKLTKARLTIWQEISDNARQHCLQRIVPLATDLLDIFTTQHSEDSQLSSPSSWPIAPG